MTMHSLHARRPTVGLLASMQEECANAERLLGASHPLARSLRDRQTATEQLLVTTVVAAAATGLLLGGLSASVALMIGAVLLGLMIALRLAVLREEQHELCDELIIRGAAPPALATVERERSRHGKTEN